jgi:tRNA (mo5U34)-methyltransferase
MTVSIPRSFDDFKPYATLLSKATQPFFQHRDAKSIKLQDIIAQLPAIKPSVMNLDQERVTIGQPADLSANQLEQIKIALSRLKPWRKGPFDLFGIQIDSEWNSALKWHRVAGHLAPLKDCKILDVGCSNGYYLFRMVSQSPKVLLGIEPYAVYYYQFQALQHFLNLPRIYCLPLKLEALHGVGHWFDTVFCMGILYHRRSPLDTLERLKNLMRSGGQLILETLIIEGDHDMALFPRDRYACMRNVFFIPTNRCLHSWLARCGFKNIHCVDITTTTLAEQCKTPWIDSESLESFLDPENLNRTVEGYPAPVRAVWTAEAP